MYESQHPHIWGGMRAYMRSSADDDDDVPSTFSRRLSPRQVSVSRLEDDNVDCPRCPSIGGGYLVGEGEEASQPSDIKPGSCS